MAVSSSATAKAIASAGSLVATVSFLIVAGSLLAWLWKMLNWAWLKPRKLEKCLREQGFTGNPYKFLFGDLKERAAMMHQANSKPINNFSHNIAPRVFPSMTHTIEKYGKNSFMWLGPYPRLHIVDPELTKNILSLHNDSRMQIPNPFMKLLVNGLVVHEGETWAKHRRIITPAFHLEKLKIMVPAFIFTCREVVSKWESMVSEKGSCELDVMPSLQQLASDAISRTAFGSSFNEGKRIFQLQKELSDLVSKATSRIYVPGWRFVPTKMNNRMKEIDKEVRALLMGIITKRQRAMEAGEAPSNDLLGVLLECNLNEIRQHGNNKDVGLSVEEIIGECKIFYFAGQETTATLLVWTMILLSAYPEWQERARAEVVEVFGDNETSYDGLSRLKVVTMILNEVLRLYPPAGMVIRRFLKDTKVGKWTIPVGVMMSFPIPLIHHDPEIWGKDAHEFKPERFAEGISKASNNQTAFYPFGWGPRVCVGQNFTMIEAKVALSTILRHFSFELSPSYTHAPTFFLTVKPQHGAHIILRKL